MFCFGADDLAGVSIFFLGLLAGVESQAGLLDGDASHAGFFFVQVFSHLSISKFPPDLLNTPRCCRKSSCMLKGVLSEQVMPYLLSG